jgi:hypothetical protein
MEASIPNDGSAFLFIAIFYEVKQRCGRGQSNLCSAGFG